MSTSLPGGLLGLSRLHAFFGHLALSILVFSVLIIVMLLWWFPGELFLLDGGWQGVRLVALVDVVLGPALTLLLYKPGKPKLVLDLTLIGAIQIAALGYGFVTTWQQRTVAVVYTEGSFTTVSHQAHTEANQQLRSLDREPQQIADVAEGRPPLLINPPPDKQQFGQYLVEILNGFPEPHERSDRYDTLDAHRNTLEQAALDDTELATPAERAAVQRTLDKHALAREEVLLHRFKSRYAEGFAVLDRNRLKIIDYLPQSAQPSVTASVGD